MKERISIILIIVLYINSVSCQKDAPCVCGNNNPLENIEWLKNETTGLLCSDVYQFFFEEKEYVVISTCPAASKRIEGVYDCAGNLICSHGGKFPIYNCSLSNAFWDSYYTNRNLFCQIRNNP